MDRKGNIKISALHETGHTSQQVNLLLFWKFLIKYGLESSIGHLEQEHQELAQVTGAFFVLYYMHDNLFHNMDRYTF